MLIQLTKTREQVDQLRKEAYLKAWPTHKQMEAFQDAANGDTTKLDKMNADFEVIRNDLPWPD